MRVEWVVLSIGMLAAIISGICAPAMISTFGRMSNALVQFGSRAAIDKCLNETDSELSFDELMEKSGIKIKVIGAEELYYEIKRYAVILIAVGLVQLLLNYIMVSCFNSNAERQTFRIRDLFLRSILRQDIAWYDTHQTSEFASRTTDDLVKLQDGIGEKLGMFHYFVANFIFCITNAFVHGWKLTLVILCIIPVMIATLTIFSKVQTKFAKREMEAYAKAGSVAEEALTAIRTVVAFGGEAKEVKRYQTNLKFATKTGIRKGFALSVSGAMLWFLIYASYALAFVYGVILIVKDIGNPHPDYDPSTLIVVFFSVLTGALQIGPSLTYLDAFSQAKAAAGTIFGVINRMPYIDSLSEMGSKPDKVEGSIEFENVKFDYPSRPNVHIINGLNLKIKSGETVALVGESGCGKSTVVQLIQRFYDPKEGVIKLDDCDIRLLNVGWLREKMGVVGQEPVLFGTTIAENIRYGLEDATQEDIERAAKMANAHEFITKLPMKYKTQVGDRGTQLSGGQKQRVAIARALVKNPRILLLDEATSALDSESEKVIQEALDKVRIGRTTIIVAHRLSTIRNADKIAIFSRGQIVEIGTHDQLMAKQGVYYHLNITQSGKETPEDQMEITNNEEMSLVKSQTIKTSKDPDVSLLPPIEFASWHRSNLSQITKRRKSSIDSV